MKLFNRIFLLATLVCWGAVTSPTSVHAGDSATCTVAIKDFEFSPRLLTVYAGSKVAWVNKDEEPHKVVEVRRLTPRGVPFPLLLYFPRATQLIEICAKMPPTRTATMSLIRVH